MFGRSSDSSKAVSAISKIVSKGGTANLSYSQIVPLACSSKDAQRNLSPDEYTYFLEIYESFRKQTKCFTVDANGYYQMRARIIEAFEKHFPFLLIDGEHSLNTELRNQIRIRKLFADGYSYQSALSIYENAYDKIPKYTNYDPIAHPEAKRIFGLMKKFMMAFIEENLQNGVSLPDYGVLYGVADTIYFGVASKYMSDYTSVENAITAYTMISLAIEGYSDSQIDIAMKERLAVCSTYYQDCQNKPNSQFVERMANYLFDYFRGNSPYLAISQVHNSLFEYHQALSNLIFESINE